MRQILLVLAIWFGTTFAAVAQSREIEDTIGNQISAFQVDDFVSAFEFASPNIQFIFRTPDNFGAMVQHGYPMVWRPSDVRFLELREIQGNLWQRVMIRDDDGRVHLLDYQMIQVGSSWKINGVQLLRTPEGNA
jgi:uncharacterized protein DUF4864